MTELGKQRLLRSIACIVVLIVMLPLDVIVGAAQVLRLAAYPKLSGAEILHDIPALIFSLAIFAGLTFVVVTMIRGLFMKDDSYNDLMEQVGVRDKDELNILLGSMKKIRGFYLNEDYFINIDKRTAIDLSQVEKLSRTSSLQRGRHGNEYYVYSCDVHLRDGRVERVAVNTTQKIAEEMYDEIMAAVRSRKGY